MRRQRLDGPGRLPLPGLGCHRLEMAFLHKVVRRVSPILSLRVPDGVRAEHNKIRNKAVKHPHPSPTLAPHERTAARPPWALDHRRGTPPALLSLWVPLGNTELVSQPTNVHYACLTQWLVFGGSRKTPCCPFVFLSLPGNSNHLIVPRVGHGRETPMIRFQCGHVSRHASHSLQTTMKHHPGSGLTVPQLVYALKLKLRRTVEHEA